MVFIILPLTINMYVLAGGMDFIAVQVINFIEHCELRYKVFIFLGRRILLNLVSCNMVL
jgi:hypothetical protein